MWPFHNEAARSAAVTTLASSYNAGEWALVPPYPLGYVQVADHLPWDSNALQLVVASMAVFGVARWAARWLAPLAGRAVARQLHGDAFLSPGGHGAALDWRRFSDVAYFTLVHLMLTAFVLSALWPEVVTWMRDPAHWWAFEQPPLSSALRAYYLVQIAANLESSLTMLHSVLVVGRARDLPMVIHHAATLFVITVAQRLGFMRVGAAVAMLHDATDLPIDFLRLGQALQWLPMVTTSAVSAIVSWAALRGYAFPRMIIWSALTRTGHMWTLHDYVPAYVITIGYALFILPLVTLYLLSMYWLAGLAKKTYSTLVPKLSSTQMRLVGASVAALVALAVAALEQAAPPSPPSPPPPPPHTHFFAVDRLKSVRTNECGYYNLSEALDAPVWQHLHPEYSPLCEDKQLMGCDVGVFDGATWTRWTSHNWQVPLLTAGAYILAIPLLHSAMASRPPLKAPGFTALWNFALAIFSVCGACVTVPQLLFGSEGGLLSRGFYASVCVHPSTYGCGTVGLFVGLFIYSKFFELVDTVLLLLRKAPVITLHWYHHASVLLYCWHSYAARIGTGLWFAVMNYCVHSLMYTYFGLTQCGPGARRLAKKASMLITLLQLSQMVIGIVVTVASLVYHSHGATCYVPVANSLLGLAMYTSYFVLFFALFQQLYLAKSQRPAPAASTRTHTRPPVAAVPAPPDTPFTGWAGKQAEIELVLEVGDEAIMGMCAAGPAGGVMRAE